MHANSRGSIPPFSLRPVPSPPGPGAQPQMPRQPRTVGNAVSPTSPILSSSSSSDPPDESFVLPGEVPDSSDPFSRFWGMLENMLEEISFPKALTAAPVSALTDIPELGPDSPTRPELRRERSKRRDKQRPRRTCHHTIKLTAAPVAGEGRAPSPTESFYVVPRNDGTQATTAAGQRRSR